ncbi:MAG TPA: PTS sugar transporter subunit IIA, partial [Candidatus Hydrogenedentes bacterium]|nr:PTS sugar transporter subunit IIA [Candidatus Hydrogenedentota bacterium]
PKDDFHGAARVETWAIGLGLNARGAMEIILGLLALEAGVIRERMFVALVIMALVTSMASGSAIQAILKPKRSVRFFDFLSARGFAGALSGPERHDAIAELSRCAAACCDATPESIFEAVWAREMVMSTSLNAGIAVPHARLPQLKTPVVTVGRSPAGIDFDAMDGQPTHIVFLILTPAEDYRSQLEILADVGRTFQAPAFVEKCVAAANYTEFLALVKSNE